MLAARLVEIYKADSPDALTVILEADGFGDLLERAEFLDRISDQDREITDEVRGLRDRPSARRSSSPTSSTASSSRPSASCVSGTRSRPSQASSSPRASELRRRGRPAAARSPQVHDSRVSLEGDLAALGGRAGARAGSSRASGQAAPRGRRSTQGSGQLIWPVSGSVVSPLRDALGPPARRRGHRRPGGHRDPRGRLGTVVLLGWVGGYGNYTCIQHNGRLSTCYAHQSSFATSNGASVSQGQVIGYVGCTGHCFGDHLHFEVRVNGSPVDPMGYL